VAGEVADARASAAAEMLELRRAVADLVGTPAGPTG
jgi:hypothetical protein